MNFDFIFSPWWQGLGAVLLSVVLVFCLYNMSRNLEDEVEEEPTSEFKPWKVGRFE